MKRRNIFLYTIVLGLLIGGPTWYLWPNHDVNRAKELGNEFVEKAKESMAKGVMPFDRNDPKAKELKEAMEKLSPEERREVGMELGLNFMNSMATMIVAAPEPLRNFVLDKAIDQMEADRQRREERRAKAEAERQANGDNGEPQAGNNGTGSGDDSKGPGRPRRPITPEEREKFMKKFLDKTKPDQRARIVLAFQMLDQRRKERGLPPMPWGGGRGR